jgi:hypothetical protein
MAIDIDLMIATLSLSTTAGSRIALAPTPRFEFDGRLLTDEMVQAGNDAFRRGLLPLPAGEFYYQWERGEGSLRTRTGVVGGAIEDGSIVLGWAERSEVGVFKLGASVCGSDGIRFTWNDAVVNADIRGREAGEELFRALVAEFFALTISLRCRDVVVNECGPSPAVKRKREKRGLQPIFEYKRITIKPELRAIYEAASEEFARNSPRLHFRRGHVRRLPQGRETYVSPCWAGNANAGVIAKDYVVT